MTRHLWLFTAVAVLIGMIVAAWAHPGGGMGGGMGMGGPPAAVTMGPPAGAPMGPPASAMSHIPSGAPLGQPSVVPQDSAARAGDSIGANVSASVRASAADTGDVQGGSSSQRAAADALGKLNAVHASPTAFKHANAHSVVGAIAAYQGQMTAALALTDPTAQAAAITAARQQLASATGTTITASGIARIDGILGITGASATLGTSP